MRIAVITGASSGMGREFVSQIAKENIGENREIEEIWVMARRRDLLESLAKTLPIPARILEGDLTKQTSYAEFKTLLKAEKPDIRILVNAAGFGKSGRAEKIYREDKKSQLAMIDLNCMALSRMTFLCLPYMKKGSIIYNLASAAAFCPQPGFAVYAATKSYVLSFSRALNAELKKRHVQVTAVCPGPVDTEFFQVSGPIDSPLKKLTMAKADRVVKKALSDGKAGKSVSVYGAAMKGTRLLTKLLPHSLLIKLLTIGKN